MSNETKNTTPEMFDDDVVKEEVKSQQEILLSEKDILAGLLELGSTKDQVDNYRKIEIRRNGTVKLEFRVRPISEDESQICMRNATKYAPTKPGQPKKAIETNYTEYRSYLVYTATVNEDRAKVWDNKKAQEALGILRGVDMIDKVLLLGEKERVLDIIDEISGFKEAPESKEQLAKN